MPSMNLPGLSGTKYVGYFAESGTIDPTWFATASAVDNDVRCSWLNALSGTNGYSWEFNGTFIPQFSGHYTFSGDTDDATVMWFGSAAEVENFDTTNFFFSADQTSFSATVSGLSAGASYPIKIQWGHPEISTVSNFSIRYAYINSSGSHSAFEDWGNVTQHSVPYTFSFPIQPVSQTGARGSLLTLNCSAIASNGAPVTYNWMASSSQFPGYPINITQPFEIDPNSESYVPYPNFFKDINELAKLFKADGNSVTVRNTDSTLFSNSPLSSYQLALSAFDFFCIPVVAPEKPYQYRISDSDTYPLIDNYPHSNIANTSINSYPVYPDAAPYYSLLDEVKALSTHAGDPPNYSLAYDRVFSEAGVFPGLIVFTQILSTSEPTETRLAATNNPNLGQHNPIYFGVNSAEGMGTGNKLTYFSQLTSLSSGYITFAQNENSATYSFVGGVNKITVSGIDDNPGKYSLNGEYVLQRGYSSNQKHRYVKRNDSDDSDNWSFVRWGADRWEIVACQNDYGSYAQLFSIAAETDYPWEATGWSDSSGYEEFTGAPVITAPEVFPSFEIVEGDGLFFGGSWSGMYYNVNTIPLVEASFEMFNSTDPITIKISAVLQTVDLKPKIRATPTEPPTYNVGMAETFSWVPVEGANRPLYARATYLTNPEDINVSLKTDNLDLKIEVDQVEELITNANNHLNNISTKVNLVDIKLAETNTLISALTSQTQRINGFVIPDYNRIANIYYGTSNNLQQVDYKLDSTVVASLSFVYADPSANDALLAEVIKIL